MLGIISVWVFVSFLYFKILFDAVFYYDISIIASLLMAVVFGVLVFFGSGLYAMRFFKYNVAPGRIHATLWELLSKTIWHLVGISIGYTTISRLIIFGFSKKLSQQLDAFDYAGNLEGDFVLFVLIVFMPVLIHYAMCVYHTYYNANRGPDQPAI